VCSVSASDASPPPPEPNVRHSGKRGTRIRFVNLHELAEERSLALHREVGRILARDPSAIERARVRLRDWKREGSVHPVYVDRWSRLLDGPFETLRAALEDRGEEARALRQVTPFAGVVDARKRWEIWREVKERAFERS